MGVASVVVVLVLGGGEWSCLRRFEKKTNNMPVHEHKKKRICTEAF